MQSYRLRTRTVFKTVNPEFNETLTFYGISDNHILTQALHILILGKKMVHHVLSRRIISLLIGFPFVYR